MVSESELGSQTTTRHTVDTQSEFSETEWGSSSETMDQSMAASYSSESDCSESPTCSDLEELYESFYSVNIVRQTSFAGSEGMGRNTSCEDTSDINSFSEDVDYSKLTPALVPLYETSDITIFQLLADIPVYAST